MKKDELMQMAYDHSMCMENSRWFIHFFPANKEKCVCDKFSGFTGPKCPPMLFTEKKEKKA